MRQVADKLRYAPIKLQGIGLHSTLISIPATDVPTLNSGVSYIGLHSTLISIPATDVPTLNSGVSYITTGQTAKRLALQPVLSI